MTPAQQRELALLALEVLISTPARKNTHVWSAYVPWSLITKIDEVARVAGLNPDAMRKEVKRIREENRRRSIAKLQAAAEAGE